MDIIYRKLRLFINNNSTIPAGTEGRIVGLTVGEMVGIIFSAANWVWPVLPPFGVHEFNIFGITRKYFSYYSSKNFQYENLYFIGGVRLYFMGN